MNKVWIVTRGPVYVNEAEDPEMIMDGWEYLHRIRSYVPSTPTLVITGTGRRHENIGGALYGNEFGASNNSAFPVCSAPCLGTPTTPGTEMASHLIGHLPNNSVVGADPELLQLLGVQDVHEIGIYQARCHDGTILCIREITWVDTAAICSM